jgi:hypothetical protein
VRELTRHQGVAAAQIEDLCGVGSAMQRTDQLLDVLLGEWEQELLVDQAVPTEASQHPHG